MDANGFVESVRMVSPLRRLPDVSILSIVKTWRFQPAMKDGYPVKYSAVIRVTSPMDER